MKLSVSKTIDLDCEFGRSSTKIFTALHSFYKNSIRVKELKNPSAKFVAEKLFNQIEFLENEKEKYKELFDKNRKKYRPIRNLMTIPGISIIRWFVDAKMA